MKPAMNLPALERTLTRFYRRLNAAYADLDGSLTQADIEVIKEQGGCDWEKVMEVPIAISVLSDTVNQLERVRIQRRKGKERV
jgi:hypothetical protein